MASLYVHIPFCVKKCAYCDFASYEGRWDETDAYADALIGEMDAAASMYGSFPVETVFFGGGTPSLLSGETVQALMDAIAKRFALRGDAEITMEANPGTVGNENLAAYRRAGVNRLSIGVQSFDDALLRRVGRIHTSIEAEDAVRLAQAAGFENISVDLIYGLPGQRLDGFVCDVRRAIGLGVHHISLYSLVVEPGTPLCLENPALASEDDVLAMQHEAQALLSPEFIRYEISNYAKPGMESRHNVVYWTRGDYLGLGAAAHSLMRGERFENTGDLSEYISGRRTVRRAALTREEAIEETVMLSTRTREGIDFLQFESQFGEDLRFTKADAIGRLLTHGLIEISGDCLRLTDRGFDIHNAVVLSLLTQDKFPR